MATRLQVRNVQQSDDMGLAELEAAKELQLHPVAMISSLKVRNVQQSNTVQDLHNKSSQQEFQMGLAELDHAEELQQEAEYKYRILLCDDDDDEVQGCLYVFIVPMYGECSTYQKYLWSIMPSPGDRNKFQVKNAETGYCLSIDDGNCAEYVGTSECHGGRNQQWELGNELGIKSVSCNKCIYGEPARLGDCTSD